ncbi:ABC transporter permease [Lachnoclostridium phytofermentans]|uniref:Inner-membrane translocator n=1 Tax=Lachnoclostridium phytofermentans (strain ATCC 700394 / DSM 18823 / ISDg) TaxID=357809 RepID=A9KSG9_LACP7|nr:ABC transporter permease [Lachnoclostridium phytofermentans]ABX43621.1 inner-membrane translocator [Lachnoclostridium phytofermentans ISDg]
MNKKLGNITKTKSFSAFTSALLAIVLGLIFGFFIMLSASPANAIDGFHMVLTGGLKRIGDVFYFATPILMTGLAVGFAFKMGLFNIGASGQFTMGMYFSLYVGFMWDLPANIHWFVCILAGMVGGMLWGVIPGLFKAFLNVNEVITSIMFNYIGMFLVDMLIMGKSKMYVSTMARTEYLPASAQIPSLGIKGSSVNVSIYMAIGIAILLYIVLNKTTFGYELKATGYNKYASDYAGMNGKKNIVLTMVIAGALAGLGGAFSILAPSTIAGSSMTYEPINVIAATGFNGIAVALLGNSSPIGIIFSAIFISHIQRGGTLTALYGYKPEIIDIVISVIIYFSAFAMLMNHMVVAFFKRKKEKSNQKPVEISQAKKVEVALDEKSTVDKDEKTLGFMDSEEIGNIENAENSESTESTEDSKSKENTEDTVETENIDNIKYTEESDLKDVLSEGLNLEDTTSEKEDK